MLQNLTYKTTPFLFIQDNSSTKPLAAQLKYPNSKCTLDLGPKILQYLAVQSDIHRVFH